MTRLTEALFPPYTYVPGKYAHPIREPEGHSFGRPEPTVDQFDPERWRECEAYLFGVDLFNAGFYWESHEQWEAVWHAAGRVGPVADFLKGLIKLAAAGVKLLEGRPQGVHRHAKRASELFISTGQQFPQLCGLRLTDLERLALDICQRVQTDAGDLGIELQPK